MYIVFRTVFPKDQVEAAFRYMAAGKHIGKVILKVREENEPTNTLTLALPRFNCLNDHSYIILGGLGGFGLELGNLNSFIIYFFFVKLIFYFFSE